MKKISQLITILILLLFSGVSCELFYPEVPNGEVRLVVIALDYTDNELLVNEERTLSGTYNDAQAIEDSFIKLGQQTNTEVEIVKLIQNENENEGIYPSKENILDALSNLNSGKYDKTIVYFSGHGVGVADSGNEETRSILGPKGVEFSDELILDDSFYFVTGSQGASSILLSGTEVIDALEEVDGSTALIVDSCHSGAITRSISSGIDTYEQEEVTSGQLIGALADDVDSNTSQVLTSSRLGEYSYETRDSNGEYYGAFTSALVRGMDVENGVPASKDGFVTLSSLYNYAKENDGYDSQLPQISGGLVDLVLFQL